MGRRALPKLDPDVDFSACLRTVDQLADGGLDALFPAGRPLEIEIGTGKGLFLLSSAAQHPDVDYLGIEIAHRYARLVAYRATKRELENVCLVHGDARRMFAEVLPPNRAVAVHVYFPDPWWKKRHHKRRILTPHMARQIERVLSPGGALHFWTDVQFYYEDAVEVVQTTTSLAGPVAEPAADPEHDLDYRTHRERRIRLEGGRIFRARFLLTTD